jgi:hypothetical protein
MFKVLSVCAKWLPHMTVFADLYLNLGSKSCMMLIHLLRSTVSLGNLWKICIINKLIFLIFVFSNYTAYSAVTRYFGPWSNYYLGRPSTKSIYKQKLFKIWDLTNSIIIINLNATENILGTCEILDLLLQLWFYTQPHNKY